MSCCPAERLAGAAIAARARPANASAVPDARDQVEDRVRDWSLAPTTIWSSRSRLRNCWPARIILQCRHGGQTKSNHVACRADLELDLLRRRVSRNGKRVDLTARNRPAGTADASPRRGAAAVPIASQVWDMNFDSDTNVIEVAMRRLRMKIDEATRSSSSRPCAAWVMCSTYREE